MRLATLRALKHVFDICRHRNPCVHAFFVHRERWRGKGRVGKRADRNGHAVVETLAGVVHGGTARGAEVERALAPFITDPNEGLRNAGNGHRPCGKSRLRSEHAAGSALAGQTMANADANRVGRRDRRELAARATGSSGRHFDVCMNCVWRGQTEPPQHPRIPASSLLHSSVAIVILCGSLDELLYTSGFDATLADVRNEMKMRDSAQFVFCVDGRSAATANDCGLAPYLATEPKAAARPLRSNGSNWTPIRFDPLPDIGQSVTVESIRHFAERLQRGGALNSHYRPIPAKEHQLL